MEARKRRTPPPHLALKPDAVLVRDWDQIPEAEEYATEMCRKGHVLEADIGCDGIKQGQKT